MRAFDDAADIEPDAKTTVAPTSAAAAANDDGAVDVGNAVDTHDCEGRGKAGGRCGTLKATGSSHTHTHARTQT